MWVRVNRCDDQKQLIFTTLDNEPLNDYGDQIRLGSELAVSFSHIREHKRPTEFTRQVRRKNGRPHRKLFPLCHA